jgi:hypothetical protein
MALFRSPAAILAAVTALAIVPAPGLPGGGAAELPILMLHRSSVAARQQSAASVALRDTAERVRELHADVWSITAYTPVLFEQDVVVHMFGATKDGASLQEAFQRYGSDAEWRRRLDTYVAEISADLTNEILLPVAGRAPPEPTLVRSWRVARAREGVFAEALALGKQLVEHVNATLPDVSLSMYMQTMGSFGTLHWLEDHASLGGWAEAQGKLLGDATFLKLQDQLNALLVEGSIQTELLELHTF